MDAQHAAVRRPPGVVDTRRGTAALRDERHGVCAVLCGVGGQCALSSALSSEARGDADAAVAKTAAIKNIQKALTARILKRLDDGQPLVEVARKMKAIEGMQP